MSMLRALLLLAAAGAAALLSGACNPLSASEMCDQNNPCECCPKGWACRPNGSTCEPPAGSQFGGGGGGGNTDCTTTGCENGQNCVQQNDGSYACQAAASDCRQSGCSNGQVCSEQWDGSYQCVSGRANQPCDDFGGCPSGQFCDTFSWTCY